jgi:hypothetical protein
LDAFGSIRRRTRHRFRVRFGEDVFEIVARVDAVDADPCAASTSRNSCASECAAAFDAE